jgi:hexosaminidase
MVEQVMRTVAGVLLCFGVWAAKGNDIRIIPEPVQVVERSGQFALNATTAIFSAEQDPQWRSTIDLVIDALAHETGFKPKLTSDLASENMLVIRRKQIVSASTNKEAYELHISANQIEIEASNAVGIFYGLQSLLQILRDGTKPADAKQINIPCVSILDFPRFGYRGMHLDVSRHFFPLSFIKRYLDILARYKINTFHWHITDSHGWRMEIKKYPKLTSIGAWRASRPGIPMTNAPPTSPDEKADYGGFYTQQEIREIVEYATKRFTTVIPEIEMPGHCTAAVVAYPEFTCLNNPVPLLVPTGYEGDLLHNFCAGYDSTFSFLNDILTEVMEVFPSEYIHIGGDEVKGASWLNCPRCRERMKQFGFSTAKQLQGYFTARIDSFVAAKGRKSIGWDEILEAGNLSRNAAVMSWRGTAGGIQGARKGNKVVMVPYRYTYFDFYQSAPDLEPDITYAGLFLDSVYAFNPITGLSPAESENLLGIQACLWTENIASSDRAEYMLLPRLLALAEVAWTPTEKKNYTQFIGKVESEFKFLDRESINYARSLYNIFIRAELNTTQRKTIVALHKQTGENYTIRYTTDGTPPSASSATYTRPIRINNSQTISAALYRNKQRIGKISKQNFSVHKAVGNPPTVSPGNIEDAAAHSKLTDGIFGTIEPYDGRWTSFRDSAVSITLDLKKIQAITHIRFRMFEDMIGNIFLPGQIKCEISDDGKKFKPLFTLNNPKIPAQLLPHIETYLRKIGMNGRFVRLQLKMGKPSRKVTEQQMFVDEIEIK